MAGPACYVLVVLRRAKLVHTVGESWNMSVLGPILEIVSENSVKNCVLY